jgi:hypothetical protein
MVWFENLAAASPLAAKCPVKGNQATKDCFHGGILIHPKLGALAPEAA